MKATAHKHSTRGPAPTAESYGSRDRMKYGIIFLVSVSVLVAFVWAVAFDLRATALPDAWPSLDVERGFRPQSANAANVTISTLSGDRARFMNFLAHDAARHGGYVESRHLRVSVDYVVPHWYYEELRGLALEQSERTDFDASAYVDWTKKMAAVPEMTEDGNLTTVEVGFVSRSYLLPGKSWGWTAVCILLFISFVPVLFVMASLDGILTPPPQRQQSKTT